MHLKQCQSCFSLSVTDLSVKVVDCCPVNSVGAVQMSHLGCLIFPNLALKADCQQNRIQFDLLEQNIWTLFRQKKTIWTFFSIIRGHFVVPVVFLHGIFSPGNFLQNAFVTTLLSNQHYADQASHLGHDDCLLLGQKGRYTWGHWRTFPSWFGEPIQICHTKSSDSVLWWFSLTQ